jgi:hypothetical protein
MPAYDLQVTPEQVREVADWADTGPDAAPVLLLADDRMLIAYQGDDAFAWDTGGEWASLEYIDVMPLDRERLHDTRALNAIQEMLSGVQWDAGTLADVAEIVRSTGRTIAEPTR